MNWNGKDVELYLREKQFIDTAIVPLISLGLGDNMKQSASQGEFISLLTLHLEHQFRGRMLLFPPLTYLLESDENLKKNTLQEWEGTLKENGFLHVFYITSDSFWRDIKEPFSENIIWLPSIPLENMEEKFKHSLLEDQVKQLINIIVQKWQNI
ncbi:YpiF family protein [Bacillus sp. FJAT-49736]|uniref:YpiF family protein n=1 Tax=Bacillus sp. FJAT-49736 TaxID=2833582 RepID=UPI001BC95A9C|nr:YpiF family protein [Bacillus sp. FJAT-49736]MBS4173266.1 YpiF family protein [Bacillus sp. FJAT-49736]